MTSELTEHYTKRFEHRMRKTEMGTSCEFSSKIFAKKTDAVVFEIHG